MNQHREDDALRGRAVNNRRRYGTRLWRWDSCCRKHSPLLTSKLPQELIKARFCNHDKEVEQAYRDLFDSSKQTLGSMMKLQEVLLVAYLIFPSMLWFLINMVEGFLTVFL